MNKNVATDFSFAVPVDGADARTLLQPAAVHPKSLLDLPCHPRILDLIVRDAISASGMAAPAVTNTATAPIS